MTQIFELRPNSIFFNPDFHGYKLSLRKLPLLKKDLNSAVDRVLPNSEQYSLLHAKLFGLHNHLYTDYTDNTVYFIDELWNVKKITVNSSNGRINDIKTVWQIPQRNERKTGSYNVSLHFTNESLALISDGIGTLHVLETGKRLETNMWKCIFSDEVLGTNTNFLIQDSIFKNTDSSENELHCLLVNINRNKNSSTFSTVINWITLKESLSSEWSQVSSRVLQATAGFYYCTLEQNCKYICIASDKQFKFYLDSERPIIDSSGERENKNNKIYSWIQTEDDITLRLNVEINCDQSDFVVNAQVNKIEIRYKDTILLSGNLSHHIELNLTTWIINSGILEVTFIKSESGLMWQDFIPEDETGEQLFDSNVVTEVHQRLAHLCNETEVTPAESGPTFSSNQLEECDFDGDNTAIFERINVNTHEVSHRINLGSHQVLMSVKLGVNSPLAIAIRHDVDACLWAPHEQSDGQWVLKHEGTLLAFGYIQASKQQRKFSSCSPDLNYSVICESSRHIFIYQQNKAITSGELRNRRNGHRIGTISEQLVVNLGDDEILGLSATNDILYVLTENCIMALKIECTEE